MKFLQLVFLFRLTIQNEQCVDLANGCQDYIDRCDLFRHQEFTGSGLISAENVKWCPATCKICALTVPFVNRCTDLAVNCKELNCNQKRIAEKYCRKSCKTCDFDLSQLFNDPDQDVGTLCLEHRLCRKLDSYAGSLKTIFCQNERLQTLCPSTCGFCERKPEGNCQDLFPVYCSMTITEKSAHLCEQQVVYQKCGRSCNKCHLTKNLTKKCEDVNTACILMTEECTETWVQEVCPQTCNKC